MRVITHLTCCMTSYMANPLVTTPPPLFMYITIGFVGSAASRNSIFPTSVCALLSSTLPFRKILLCVSSWA